MRTIVYMMLAFVMLQSCGEKKETLENEKADSTTTKNEPEKTMTKEDSLMTLFNKFDAIQIEGLLKLNKMNAQPAAKFAQVFFDPGQTDITNAVIQINECSSGCYESRSMADWNMRHADKGAETSKSSGIWDAKTFVENINGQEVFVATKHYKGKSPEYNFYTAAYQKKGYQVTVTVVGTYDKLSNDYAIEKKLGNDILTKCLAVE